MVDGPFIDPYEKRQVFGGGGFYGEDGPPTFGPRPGRGGGGSGCGCLGWSIVMGGILVVLFVAGIVMAILGYNPYGERNDGPALAEDPNSLVWAGSISCRNSTLGIRVTTLLVSGDVNTPEGAVLDMEVSILESPAAAADPSVSNVTRHPATGTMTGDTLTFEVTSGAGGYVPESGVVTVSPEPPRMEGFVASEHCTGFSADQVR